MAEFDINDFKDTFDFFILSGLNDGPRSLSEIERRIQWAERLLYLAAKRRDKQGFGSLLEVLAKLEGEGCLKHERLGEQPGTEIIYSLTDIGSIDWNRNGRVEGR